MWSGIRGSTPPQRGETQQGDDDGHGEQDPADIPPHGGLGTPQSAHFGPQDEEQDTLNLNIYDTDYDEQQALQQAILEREAEERRRSLGNLKVGDDPDLQEDVDEAELLRRELEIEHEDRKKAKALRERRQVLDMNYVCDELLDVGPFMADNKNPFSGSFTVIIPMM